MPTEYNDGGLQTGGRLLTIGPTPDTEGNKVYVATAFSVTRPSTKIQQSDKDGKPAKQKFVDGFVTGTATLQFPDDDAWSVQRYWQFSLTGLIQNDAGEDVTETFIISEVGIADSQNGERQQTISFDKKLN